MKDLEKVVLGKCLAEKEVKAARRNVGVGNHAVDFTVRVVGTAEVREDYERAATTSVPWLEVTGMLREGFRVAVEDMISSVDAGRPVTRDDLVRVMESGPICMEFAVECVRRCLERDESGTGSVREVVELEEAVKSLLRDTSAKLPPQKVPGAVVLDVQVEEVVSATPSKVAVAVKQRVPQVV